MFTQKRTTMGVCWMLIILLGCRLSHASQSQSTCACNERLETRCVPANGSASVSVPCPSVSGEELAFNLHKDGETIYTCTHERNSQTCEPRYARLDVRPDKNKENKLVGFIVTGAAARSHGIYRCEGIVIYPPPYIKNLSDPGILVIVEGDHCLHRKDNSNPTGDNKDTQRLLWVWIMVVGLLSTYSLAVTILASVSWFKLRTESQNDYMNTKPRAPRNCRKKRGLQNPIPRHF